jgi:hypothetical protein
VLFFKSVISVHVLTKTVLIGRLCGYHKHTQYARNDEGSVAKEKDCRSDAKHQGSIVMKKMKAERERENDGIERYQTVLAFFVFTVACLLHCSLFVKVSSWPVLG